MSLARKAAGLNLTLVDSNSTEPAEFTDRESRRVLAAAAVAVARELGREAAREHFAEFLLCRLKHESGALRALLV